MIRSIAVDSRNVGTVLDAVPVEITCELLERLPSCKITGVSAIAARELAEIARSAIVASGLNFPRKRVVITVKVCDSFEGLSPSGMRPTGASRIGGLALPIALAILEADGQFTPDADTLYHGDLSLGGALRPRGGAVAAAQLVGLSGAIVTARPIQPTASRYSKVYGCDTLIDVVKGKGNLEPTPLASRRAFDRGDPPLSKMPERPLWWPYWGALSAAKALAGARFVTPDTRVYLDRTYDACNMPAPQGAPFRAPHHTGSRKCMINEIAIARGGVLFLDDAREFRRDVIEQARAAHMRGDTFVIYGGSDEFGRLAKWRAARQDLDAEALQYKTRAAHRNGYASGMDHDDDEHDFESGESEAWNDLSA